MGFKILTMKHENQLAAKNQPQNEQCNQHGSKSTQTVIDLMHSNSCTSVNYHTHTRMLPSGVVVHFCLGEQLPPPYPHLLSNPLPSRKLSKFQIAVGEL